MILSISGLFKMILMIIGGFIILRFVGQLMNAKRNMEAERQLNEQNRKFESEKKAKLKTYGKTRVVKNEEVKGSVKDVDFEEVD